MRRDGPFRSRAPLTAIEITQRAAVLRANQALDLLSAPAVSAEIPDEVVAITDKAALSEKNDERLYGLLTAKFLRDCRRDVAAAPEGARKIVFQDVSKRIGEAVADQWLTKAAMMDRLQDIAEGHASFGLNPEQLQQLIADAAEAIRIPQATPGIGAAEATVDYPPGKRPATRETDLGLAGANPGRQARAGRRTAGPGQEPVDRIHGCDDFKWRGLAVQ
jgi:hypothetical protein